jgi:RNA polymerase sigma-70 factor (ECF subfamily)
MAAADRFEAFVRKHQDMVFGTAVRLLGDRAEAEDVAQTVFLKAFQRFGADADSALAPAWLKVVTRNACLNHLTRYRARWRFFSELSATDDEGAEAPFDVAGHDTAPLDVLEGEQRSHELEHALQALPNHQRVPLVLFHLEDMSYQEIASALGVSLGKVKTDIFRAREALRKRLAASHES